MTNLHLAQINIGRMKAPLDDPSMAGFMSRLADLNALADRSKGFVWRLQGDDGNNTYLRPTGRAHHVTFGMGEHRRFTRIRSTEHLVVPKQRRDWFEKFDGVIMALWWIPPGFLPFVHEEAAARALERYADATPLLLKTAFPPILKSFYRWLRSRPGPACPSPSTARSLVFAARADPSGACRSTPSARGQHRAYEQALIDAGCLVERLTPHPTCPTRSLSTSPSFRRAGEIITRPGRIAAARNARNAEALTRRLLHVIEPPGTVDGGDVPSPAGAFVGRSPHQRGGVRPDAQILHRYGYTGATRRSAAACI
jgi:hypothetical protein